MELTGTKLLVTGGAGFIGSAVIRKAILTGYKVLNLDVLTYAACLDNLKTVCDVPEYTFVKVDIRNRELLDKIFEENMPDAIMHLAAETHVDRSIDTPDNFIQTNIMGTYNLLEASRRYWESRGKPKEFRFHHISTDEVFGSLPDDSSIKFTEKTPYEPSSPYSASKASSDHLVRSWSQTYGLPIVITNCSNNYGPYQFPEKLVPVTILNALAGQSIPIYGSGDNKRDWLYVEDHVDALLTVLQRGELGRSYNIGSENEISNLEIVEKICQILNKKNLGCQSYEDLITFVEDRPGHDQRYAIDTSRINHEIGWRPKVSLDEGLEKTIQWYLVNKAWWKPLKECRGPRTHFIAPK